MIPVKLVIKNFLSHNHSEIDFDKFNIALVIGSYDGNSDQSNGAGKSALFESMLWALFGKSRHKKKDGVVKRDAKLCQVEFWFKVDNIIYKVTRKRDKVLGESDVIFEQDDGSGNFKSISCDTNTATDKKIVDTINVNDDVFINSVYFRQNDVSIFAESRPSVRKDIIKALLKMERWDAYQKKAKDNANVLRIKIEEKNNQIIPVDNLKKEIENCDAQLLTLKSNLESSWQQYEILNTSLADKKAQLRHYQESNYSLDGLNKLQQDWDKAKKKIYYITNKLNENKEIIDKNSAAISLCKQKSSQLNAIINKRNGVDLDKVRGNLIKGRTTEKILRDKIGELKQDIDLGDKCSVCFKPLSKKDVEQIKHKHNDHLAEIKGKYSKVKDMLSRAEKDAREKEEIVDKANKAELDKGKIALKISKLDSEIQQCSLENEQLSKELAILSEKDFETEIGLFKSKLESDEDNKLFNDVRALESRLAEHRKVYDKLNFEYGSFNNKKNELIEKEKLQIVLKKELDKLKDDFSVYDKLRNYFGKDGIQSIIIENVIDELEEYSNQTLSKICNEPTSLKIVTQKQSDTGSWAETFDIEVTIAGRTDEFETFSGGEKFRISLALRLALSKILSKRMGGNLQFLLLDEVSSSLDNKGLEMFINVVKQLSSDMKIMVITHDEKLKDSFDHTILIKKEAIGSRIVVEE